DENGKAIDYIFMEINDAFEELTGLKRKKIIGKKVTEALPGIENDPADWIGKYGEVALAGKELRFEQYAEPLDRWYSVTAFCPKEGYFATVFEDITERIQSEKELNRLSTAVKQSPASIVITDTAGNIEFVNQKFSEVTGYTYEESMGQNPGILKSGEQSQKFYKELWNTISSGKNWRGEFHNKKKNGELYWEDALISPVIDKEGKIINYIALKEDITEQKKNEQIQKIIHNISNAAVTSDSVEGFIMLVKNQLGTIIDTNNFYVALYNDEDDSFSIPFVQDKKNTTRTVPPGKTYTHYVFNTKETLLATQTIMAKLEHSGKVEPYGPKSKIWLGVPLISKEKVLGVIAVQSYEDEKAFDESDMKVLEFISQQISLSLERKKAEEDLKKALEKAQESDRLKSAFLANMSHEIRTPMNGILGFTDLLKAPNLTGDEKDECIQIIEKSGNRMLNTINDIVDISKIEAGMIEVEKSEVSVNNILEGLYNFFVREAGEKGLELKYNPSLSDTESRIVTDQHKLEGILTNLIKNAVKFTEKGSITFGCTLKDTENEKCLEFYVTDTGIGIPADIIDAIFNRFEQADMGIARAFEGSGLGLAISKSYVEMLGGSIWVESEEGKGSTFSFTIPYSGKTVKKNGTEQKKEAQSVTSLDHLSVIIAEDDEISQLFFKTIFKNMFKKITYTTTGKETIDECRRNPDTDIILMDIQMPEMSGYDAAREIRKFNKDVIIISQTAYGFSIDRKKALEAGCDDYIAKPIKKKEMLEIINRQIEERKK
ncbi:MAG: PAS domain S-box protein, partial [Fidelibacterota bacterium]